MLYYTLCYHVDGKLDVVYGCAKENKSKMEAGEANRNENEADDVCDVDDIYEAVSVSRRETLVGEGVLRCGSGPR